MSQEMNNAVGAEKNITTDSPITAENTAPKRRGRSRKDVGNTVPASVKNTSEAKFEPTPVLEAVADTPATAPNEPKTSKRHYPTISERLAAVDDNIARLTKLNESRVTLIAKTQAALEERRIALEKSTKALNDAQAKKSTLVELQNRPSKPPVVKAPKLSPEERQQARVAALERARTVRKEKKEARMAEEAKVRELVAMLKASGRSVEEFFKEVSQDKE
ncbi:MAG: hypothetical protein VB111_01885 [Clostridiaceae bacterium]|nr:hypothetical protein [Clostridiaceae bacterium]